MKRVLVVLVVGMVLMGSLAVPAMANHDHQLHNPGGCHTIPVAHQDHGTGDPGKKFHGAAHKGAATDEVGGKWVLGQGNSVVYVDGNACP